MDKRVLHIHVTTGRVSTKCTDPKLCDLIKLELLWTAPLLATCFHARNSTEVGNERKHLEEQRRGYLCSDFDKMPRLFMQSSI